MDIEQPAPPSVNQLSLDKIRKLGTFGRQAIQSNSQFIRPMIKELMRTPYQEVEHLNEKIKKVFEYVYTFRGPENVKFIHHRLVEKIPSKIYGPIWRNYNLAIGDFIEAIDIAHKLWVAEPGNIFPFEALINCYFAAGYPEDAFKLLEDNSYLFQNNFTLRMLPIILAANRHEWLKVNQNYFYQTQLLAMRKLEAADIKMAPVKTYCISMARDVERLRTCRFFMESNKIEFHHILGIEGAKITPEIYAEIFSNSEFPICTPGELGCAIAHFNACKAIANNCQDDEYGLVIEDDARFIYGDARGLELAIRLAKETEREMVFLNLRACCTLLNVTQNADVSQMGLSELFETVESKVRQRNPGWGGEGYLVSGKGARRLIEIWEKIGIVGAVDWQLAFMSLKNLDDVLPRRAYRGILQHFKEYNRQNPDFNPIDSAVMSLPIISTVPSGYSSIDRTH